MKSSDKQFLSLTKEILSWRITKTDFYDHFYLGNVLGTIYPSPLEYEIKMEPLFLNELKTQLEKTYELGKKRIKLREAKKKGQFQDRSYFYLVLETKKGETLELKKGDFTIVTGSHSQSDNLVDFNFVLGKIVKVNMIENSIIIQTNHQSILKISKKNYGYVFFCPLKEYFKFHLHLKEYYALGSLKNLNNYFSRILFSIGMETYKEEPKVFLKNHFDEHMELHFNKSQIKGILSSTQKIISLIQGPPGTGKTRTIIGVIVGCRFRMNFATNSNYMKNIMGRFFNQSRPGLVRKTYNHFFLENKSNDGKNSQKNTFPFKNLKKADQYDQRKKILVCALSNAAIDEIVSRIILGYPLQKINKSLKPGEILRIGPNYNDFIDHVSMENLLIFWLSENDLNLRYRTYNKFSKLFKTRIISQSKVIFSTLACSGYSILKNSPYEFDIIIDEAAQATELSTIIPIENNCKKLVLIGDVQQLPATLFSKGSIKTNFDRSLFKRLQMRNFQIWFLETQYRMHPQISSYPARKFYMNGLKDSSQTFRTLKFQALKSFGPLIFFDICDSFEKNHLEQFYSWCNLDETRVISTLFKMILCIFPEVFKYSFGVIAAYNGQVVELDNYGRVMGEKSGGQIGTVDGYQGKEKDIIILSSVRSRIEKGIGFLSDCRRMNVAFTRAKHSFWIIGNYHSLSSDQNWKEAMDDIQRRNYQITLRKPYERSFRRALFWSSLDDTNYSFDGSLSLKINHSMYNYICDLRDSFV